MSKNNDYIIRNGARVLYPSEYKAIRDEMFYRHKLIFDCMLLTGMRVVEFWRFVEHPEWLKTTRKCIDLPKGSMLKTRAKQAERTVLLSNLGLHSVESMLAYRQNNNLSPMSKQGWQQALKGAAVRAVEEGALETTQGIVPKMTRKTWISWLLVTHPMREGSIAISSGHDTNTMLRHYTGLGFPSHEIELMRMYTAGWGE